MLRQRSVKIIAEDTCKSIYKKIGSKARFSPTSKIQLSPPSIKNISTDFPTTRAKLIDSFQVHKADTGRHVTIYLSCTMSGTPESVLYDSMVNILKQNNIWLTSKEIAATRKDEVGFIQNGNPTYTHLQGATEKLMTAITKLASTNSVAAALFDKIKGEKFMFCRSNRLYGKMAIGEGISILTTNNNYRIIMRLIKMLPPNVISHYYRIRHKY